MPARVNRRPRINWDQNTILLIVLSALAIAALKVAPNRAVETELTLRYYSESEVGN